MKTRVLFLILVIPTSSLLAQNVFVPGGTVGASQNSHTGIGTASPADGFHVYDSLYGAMIESAHPNNTWLRLKNDTTGGRVWSLNSAGASWSGGAGSFFIYDETAGAERLRINQSGNVGIGTTSPSVALDVNGSGVKSTVSANYAFVANSTFANPAVLGHYEVARVGSVKGYLGLDGNDNLALINSGGSPSLSVNSSGNVGIGTTNPSQKLTVTGALNVTTPGTLTASSATNGLNLGYDNNSEHSWIQSTREDTSHLRALALNPLGGNVGIGTTSPTQKLSVNGTIQAKEVIVQTGWSDYVFAKGYRLAPLSEVEQHIEKDGHLPGIPSAKEVAEHGVSMGEMQSKLLAKIEELTLHVIAQEKRAVAQQNEIAALRNQLSTLSHP